MEEKSPSCLPGAPSSLFSPCLHPPRPVCLSPLLRGSGAGCAGLSAAARGRRHVRRGLGLHAAERADDAGAGAHPPHCRPRGAGRG